MLARIGPIPPHNMSIDADPQQQEAASPQVLVVRSFLRYAACSAFASGRTLVQ
jgi:hypothetical protein